MRHVVTLTVVTALLLGAAAPTAHAQKGVGDPTGVARQPVKPKVVSLSGKLGEVRTGPCEATTGRALNGTHIILETAQEEQLNIHLGPAAVMAETVARLSVGQPLAVNAFRTEKMKENHYVAQSLTFGETTIHLRDEHFRPAWAGGNARPQGTAAGQVGPGWGRGQGSRRGQGQGPAQGWGRGQGSGRGQGRGPAQGGGRGQGQGPAQGGGRGQGRGFGNQRLAAPPQREQASFEKGGGKLAVTAAGPSMDAAVAPQFGRSPYFILVNPEDDTFEVLDHKPAEGRNAAGQATDLIAGKGATVLLTGKCGPKALEALAAAGIQVVSERSGIVRDVVEQFKAEKSPPADKTQTPPGTAPRTQPATHGQ